MRRRDFIAGLGGAVAWPALSAQQRLRLIGMLTSTNVQAADAAFVGGLAKAGWIEGRNVGIERRFSGRSPAGTGGRDHDRDRRQRVIAG
jgi:hypothetical protein